MNDKAIAAPENYVPLAMTAHGWSSGKGTTPYATVVDRLRREWGGAHMKKHGYILYLVHPDFEVCGVSGSIQYPKGSPPLKIEDRRPVEWSRDGDQYVGTLPGGKEVRMTPWEGPLGRYFEISVKGQDEGKVCATGVGGGDPKDLLKRAKTKAEELLKL